MALQESKLAIDGAALEGQVPAAAAAAELDYAKRAQWLRAAVLGANDGLVSTTSLILGVGAVKDGARAMLVAGFAGLVAGACSMAIGEFVSVHSQLDAELARLRRAQAQKDGINRPAVDEEIGGQLPSPVQAAAASALAFSVGAAMPLLAAGFISDYKVRMGVVAAAATAALLGFGIAGAVLGRAPVGRSCARVVAGGCVAMAVTFGLMKLFGSTAL